MATKSNPSRPTKLTPDKLVERLVPDASQLPDVRVLVGFLGKSTGERHWRLYLTPTLSEYVEFAENDVVHSHSFDSDDNRLGGTAVWVKREANLRHTRSASREAQADFLRGAISASVPGHGGRCDSGRPVLGWQRPVNHFLSFAGHADSCVSDICALAAPSFMSGGNVWCTQAYACYHTHPNDTDC